MIEVSSGRASDARDISAPAGDLFACFQIVDKGGAAILLLAVVQYNQPCLRTRLRKLR